MQAGSYSRGNHSLSRRTLYLSDTSFSSPRRDKRQQTLSKKSSSGETAEIVHWRGGDGSPWRGFCNKPEGFDPAKKYPMIVYYYEAEIRTCSTGISPPPSAVDSERLALCEQRVSIFIPDIRYRSGYPGKSATTASYPAGVKNLSSPGDSSTKTGWGCRGRAGGGIPDRVPCDAHENVPGGDGGGSGLQYDQRIRGIRWESGIARMHQYEKEQSRIGRDTLAASGPVHRELPTLPRRQRQTPLLMMNNVQTAPSPGTRG